MPYQLQNMPGTPCCIKGCHNNTNYSRHVSFHCFPKHEQLRKLWIDEINHSLTTSQEKWLPGKYSRICGAHFNRNGRKGPKDIVPIYFPWNVPDFQPKPKYPPNKKSIYFVLHDHTYCIQKKIVIQQQETSFEWEDSIKNLHDKVAYTTPRTVTCKRQTHIAAGQ